jgi:DNA-binding NarL/FixJ family response regulator
MSTDETQIRAARKLSPRQRQILKAIATGAERKEIAGRLKISPNTVDAHCRNLYARLGIQNARQATALAIAAFGV